MKVLIADDSAMGRLLLQSALETLGHECLSASGGKEAWDLYQSTGADVIISDWMMPGLEGPELCRLVRSSGRTRYTYFILLTTFEDKQHALAGMDAGADDYLPKPLNIDELRLRLVAAQRVTLLYKELAERDARLQVLAETDALTCLLNRHRSTEVIEHFLGLATREHRPLALVVLDLDHFKQVNDRYGHAAGDAVLRTFGQVLKRSFREHDVVGRWGGEEFAAAMYGMTKPQAVRRMEGILGIMSVHAFTSDSGQEFRVTFSSGVAEFPDDATDLAGLYRLADGALYKAKESGRARILAACSSPSVELDCQPDEDPLDLKDQPLPLPLWRAVGEPAVGRALHERGVD